MTKSKVTFLILSIFLASVELLYSSALQVNIINVTDRERIPLPGATVQLHLQDNVESFTKITDVNGTATFAVFPGVYRVVVRFIGMTTIDQLLEIIPGQSQYYFILQEEAHALAEVTVTARRPLIRQEGDKVIIDPEPLAGISTNTLEVLEMTPGLFVDPEGGVFLNSTTPATIYINGRIQRMSQQDINNILRSLPPGSVQRIEIVRTPSTRFDAATSGGIINIVLKQGMRIGRFGSVSTGFNQGDSGNRFASISLNNSNDRITSFLNAGINFNGVTEDLNSTRFMPLDERLMQTSVSEQDNTSGNLGLGLTFELNQNATFTYDGRITGGLRSSAANNRNYMGTSAINNTIGENVNLLNNDGQFVSLQQDLGFRWQLDTLGSEWDTRIGYGFGNNISEQNYTNTFVFPVFPSIVGFGDSRFARHSFLLQSDFTYHFNEQVMIEAGLKSAWIDFSSDSEFFIDNNGSLFPDRRRTNSFLFIERINAIYTQATFKLPVQLTLKTGFRLENTIMEGRQTIPNDTNFVVNRTDFFPYAFLSRRLFEVAGIELRGFLIYRRTIGRPDYATLNPAIRYVDQFLFETGNPALKPQFTHNIEANISFDDFPVFAVGRNYTSDIFSSVVYQDPTNPMVAVRTFDNLGRRRETYFNIVVGIPPGRTYFFAIGAQYNINEFDGFYENQPLSFSRGSWRFFTFHQLRLGKTTRVNLSGFMITNGQQNFYELDTFGQLNIGLSQTFFNQRLSVTINARDVLRTMETQFNLNQGSMNLMGARYMDSRRIGINIRYNFGVEKRPERRNMMQFDMEE